MKIPIILIGCLCIVGSLLYYVFHDPFPQKSKRLRTCLLYTSDAADE